MFKNFSTVCTAAFAALLAFSCSSQVAGTAEETNQVADNTLSSSSTANRANPTSSQTAQSSEDKERLSSSESNNIPQTESSSSERFPGLDPIPITSSAGGENYLNPPHGSTATLDNYLKKYNVTGASFDENVIAYKVTYKSCDPSQTSCNAVPDLPPFASEGLYKITDDNLADAISIYSITSKYMGGTLASSDGCPLYILNIRDYSPAVHVLKKITKDTLAVEVFYDGCDYERNPFDLFVGFLFSYCGELSENPKIALTSTLNESMPQCGTIDYKEYVNKKIIIEAADNSQKQK